MMKKTHNIEVTNYRLETIENLKDIWTSFEEDPDISFFQTWPWIRSWWENSGRHFESKCYIVKQNNEIRGLAIFSKKALRRRHFFVSRALHLNESPYPRYNFNIEHNGILTRNADEKQIAEEIVENILNNEKEIDEIVFSGISKNRYNIYKDIGTHLGLRALTNDVKKYSYVDLDKIRQNEGNYLNTLRKKTRYNINKSLQAYSSTQGKVLIEEAKTLSEALIYLSNLKVYHEEYWKSKGKHGSFSNVNWEMFVKSMIQNFFHEGHIQLLRISAGDTDIGYILNLAHNRYVNVLQTGFNYIHGNKKLMPGYISHYLAIEYNLKSNNMVYDFLAGESHYKNCLATNHDCLYWLTLQKKCPKYFIENIFLKVIHFLKRSV